MVLKLCYAFRLLRTAYLFPEDDAYMDIAYKRDPEEGSYVIVSASCIDLLRPTSKPTTDREVIGRCPRDKFPRW